MVDDGSPDRCGEICDDFAKKDKRVIVVHKENGGLSATRNAGMAVMTGTYFYFLDSDDYIEIKTLEILFDKNIAQMLPVMVQKEIHFHVFVLFKKNPFFGLHSEKREFMFLFPKTNSPYSGSVFVLGRVWINGS